MSASLILLRPCNVAVVPMPSRDCAPYLHHFPRRTNEGFKDFVVIFAQIFQKVEEYAEHIVSHRSFSFLASKPKDSK